MEKVKAGKELQSRSDRIVDRVNVILLCLVLVVTLYPLYFMLIASFSSIQDIYAGKVIILPSGLNLKGYAKIFADKSIWNGYGNAILYTVVGTLINVVLTVPLAFILSRREMPGCGIFMKVFVFTMYFYGGIIPTYLVVKQVGLLDSMWALVLPTAIATYNMIIARSFFISSIPEELKEAAFLDGCNYTCFFIHVVLPLSKAIIAIMALFYGATHWNDYFYAMIYLNTPAKFPLQMVLRNILISNQMAASMGEDATTVAESAQLIDLLKYGCVIVSSVPMLIIYPFIQKYFVKGVMIGAVKG